MENGRSPYDILGLQYGAGKEEIREAYRNLVRRYQPENYVGNPLAALAKEKLAEINAAYDELMGAGNYSAHTSETDSAKRTGTHYYRRDDDYEDLEDGVVDPCSGRSYPSRRDYRYRQTQVTPCCCCLPAGGCCHALETLYCLDCCCECMGGDLCSCC